MQFKNPSVTTVTAVFLSTVLLSTLALNSPASAQDATLDGGALYAAKACVACHGVAGKSPITNFIPKLAGQNKGYLIQQLKDIKSGARDNGQTAQMKGIIANVSDDEAKAIAEYLSAL